ncbi:hypothetical protein D3C75_135950 [compost metagenome]
MDPVIKARRFLEIMYYEFVSVDSRGKKTYNPPVPLLCYKAGKITTVRNFEGVQVVSSLQMYVDGYLTFKANDQFEDAGIKYPIQAYSSFAGLATGTGTTVVYL